MNRLKIGFVATLLIFSSLGLHAEDLAFESDWVQIQVESGQDESIELLKKVALEATEIYQKHYNKLLHPVKIIVGRRFADDQYDLRSKVVTLSEKDVNGRIAGLNAPDIVRHELFHAMYCQGRDVLCSSSNTSDEFWAMNEALADFFAYSIEPKEYLALGVYRDAPFVRRYVSSYCYSLTGSDHDRGNAVTTALIRGDFAMPEVGQYLSRVVRPTLKDLLSLNGRVLTDSCFFERNLSPSVATGASHSYVSQGSLKLFELKGQNDPVTISLEFSEQLLVRYPGSTVKWSVVGPSTPRIEIQEISRSRKGFIFRARPLSDDFFEDWKATIVSAHGEELGNLRYGFIKPNRPLRQDNYGWPELTND